VAVFDGHSGTFAAEYCSMNLKSKIEESASWQAYMRMSQKTRKQNANTLGEALVQAYLQLDDSLKSLHIDGLMEDNSGCTAVCCIITPTHVVCASVGDSRAVIGGKETTVSLTEDHKPENPEECVRIEQAGGFVADNRVLGELAMSRAIGDFRYKGNTQLAFHEQLVIAVPDVSVHERDLQNDHVLIVACDGVWDVLSNDEAVVFAQEYIEKPAAFSIHDYIQKDNSLREQEKSEDAQPLKKRRVNADPEEDDNLESSSSDSESGEDGDHVAATAVNSAGALISVALAKGSMDNISAVVVKFPAVNSLQKN
jgi:serine/threonine protein phosphatase PrpC